MPTHRPFYIFSICYILGFSPIKACFRGPYFCRTIGSRSAPPWVPRGSSGLGFLAWWFPFPAPLGSSRFLGAWVPRLLAPVPRPPGFLEVPRGLGSSPVGSLSAPPIVGSYWSRSCGGHASNFFFPQNSNFARRREI